MASAELQVPLNFLDWQELYASEKPFQIFIDIPEDAEDQRDTNLVFKKVNVAVRDVRESSTNFSLDANGFIFRKYVPKTTDFSQRTVIERSYLPEIEKVLKEELEDVDRVFVFDWRVSLRASEHCSRRTH